MDKTPKCNLCGKKYSSRSNLNHHIKGVHENIRYKSKKLFKCNVCDYQTCEKSAAVGHMRTHTNERPFKCTINECGMAFKQKSHLKDHIMYKHNDERPFKCNFPGCTYAAKTSASIYTHKKTHSDDQPFACPRTGCDYRAKFRQRITEHFASVHSGTKAFACSLCDFKTHRLQSIKHHTRRHTSTRDFKCNYPECGQSFKCSLYLRRHFSNRHGERNLPCNHPGCERKYTTSTSLRLHKRMVHSEKSLACPHLNCSYRTNVANSLASHRIVHDGRNEKISCSIEGCQHKGKNIRAVKAHMRHHKTILQCPVSHCGHNAFATHAMKDHTKLHNSLSRPFQCPLCYKHYQTLFEMKKHCATHTNEKPYKCGHCELTSASGQNVRSHISRAHANIKFPFIILPLDERECLQCGVTLSLAEFIVHSMGHAIPVVLLERLKIIT